MIAKLPFHGASATSAGPLSSTPARPSRRTETFRWPPRRSCATISADVVQPAEHQSDRDRLRARIFDLPFEDADRVAALAVVAGDHRAELPLRQPHRELVPVVLEPGIGEQAVVGAGALGQIPVPAGERVGPDRREDVGRPSAAPRDVDRELIGRNGLEPVAAHVEMPPREVAAMRSADRPGSHAAEWHATPRRRRRSAAD